MRATFFVVGERAQGYPGLVCQVIAQGSEVGSHSWRHARLDRLAPGDVGEDLRSAAQAVYEAAGRAATLFRPPYGRYNEATLAAARELRQGFVIWDVDPRDWASPPPEAITARIMRQVKPGSIILLHEGHANTLTALPAIIRELRQRGLEPVPVSELLARHLDQRPGP